MESGSRYGGASLAAGEGGAFQSWLGYTIVEAAREKREKNQTEGGELQGGKFLESLERVHESCLKKDTEE